MDANQLGRRNLTKDQYTLLLGRRYNRVKKQGARKDLTSDQNDHKSESTADALAKEYGVGPATVRRAGKYAEAVETIQERGGGILPSVLAGRGADQAGRVSGRLSYVCHPRKPAWLSQRVLGSNTMQEGPNTGRGSPALT